MFTRISILSLAAAFAISVIVFAATQSPNLNIPAQNFKLSTVEELRIQASKMPKILVLNGGKASPELKELSMQPSAQSDSYNDENGNPAYRTGTGVVLTSYNLSHSPTGSNAVLSDCLLNSNTVHWIKNSTQGSYITLVVPRKNPGWASISCFFHQLPKTTKTYMLTVGLDTLDKPFKIHIGSNPLDKNQLAINPSTDEIRALFTYNAGNYSQNGLYVYVSYAGPQNVSPVPWKFRYIQLTQLD